MRFLLFGFLFLLAACSSQKNEEYLPRATGKPGDLLIIMDSVQWNGELGKTVRQIFAAPVAGLPQDEPLFDVIWVHPSKGITLLTQIRNLVYVFTLDQSTKGSQILRSEFSPESLDKVRGDSAFFMTTRKNEYARGQEVMYLFGQTEEQLIEHLKENQERIARYFVELERKRLEQALFETKSTEGITELLQRQQGITLRVPIGYKVADQQNNFIWLRNIGAITDKDVFLAWKPYTSEYQLLPDSLIAWRNEIARKYLYEDPEIPDSYLTTEQENAQVLARQVDFKGQFAIELRGLWKTNNNTMGGPFLSYALVDQEKALLYYIEGFAYAPGENKREMMRELETILWTFGFSSKSPEKAG